jgi:hypothetical protein
MSVRAAIVLRQERFSRRTAFLSRPDGLGQPSYVSNLGAGVIVCFALWLCSAARAAETGSIAGTLDKPEQVTAVVAVDRATDKKYPGKVDIKSGRFTIEGLPLDATYDCLIDHGSARLEGINLKVPRSDYEKEQPLSKEDVETIKKTALSLNKFEDVVDVLTVTGNIQHAAVVLNKLRTQPFVGSQPGEIIWRLELWRFDRPDDTWIKSQDELFLVLYRERLQKSAFEKKALTLDPALGGITLNEKQPTVDLGTIKLPAGQPGVRLRPEAAADKAGR